MKKRFWIALAGLLLLTACASNRQAYDYTAFQTSNPASILVLPPINESPDVAASNSVLTNTVYPLAESGYYVFPVEVVKQAFRHNGLDVPNDIHAIPLDKLQEVFGTDAVLYITVTEYGTSYRVVQSGTDVAANARLVDARTGATLWTGSARASSNEGNNNSSGNIIGMLLTAVIQQIVESVADKGYDIAGVTSNRLLSASVTDGILYGPRSPKYWKNQPKQ
ncbi:DUF799 domain-containing protein [Pelistega ratti]|uniref:DUF799 domain-containing protein n=1 Tax=Pelistega ratti TaxID=2652177 RepID=UPI001358DC85|nr:DUF799 domain-containing protein [Pelistega ratti]